MYPLNYVYVTVPFGVSGSWAAGKHTGTDFRAAVGTNVYATRGGRVTHVGWGGYGEAYGFHVIIAAKTITGQERRVLYAHLSSSPLDAGEYVDMGDYIGESGETGRTFGAHLHYEERVSPFGYYNYASPVFLKYPKLFKVTVRLSRVKPGKKNRHIRRVQRRLNKRLRGPDLTLSGYYGLKTRQAYKRWQEKLGYSGSDADGVAGRKSLEKLGFNVKP